VLAVVFLYQITACYNKTQHCHFWNYFNDSMQTVYARGGGGGGIQQREVADGPMQYLLGLLAVSRLTAYKVPVRLQNCILLSVLCDESKHCSLTLHW